MLLQTQYKWYKLLLYVLILLIIVLAGASGAYLIRGKLYERDINKKILEINQIQKDIQLAKTDGNYKIYQMWEVIYKNQNNVNYVALYEYLNQVKNYILKDLKKYTISRLILSVKPHEVNLDTTLPNYNVIYFTGWLVDLIANRPFVDEIQANNFRKLQNGINVKLKIKTK